MFVTIRVTAYVVELLLAPAGNCNQRARSSAGVHHVRMTQNTDLSVGCAPRIQLTACRFYVGCYLMPQDKSDRFGAAAWAETRRVLTFEAEFQPRQLPETI